MANTHDKGRLFGFDGINMWFEPSLEEAGIADAVANRPAHCGRTDLHGGHMAGRAPCLGNLGEPIVAIGCTCHRTDKRCAAQGCNGHE